MIHVKYLLQFCIFCLISTMCAIGLWLCFPLPIPGWFPIGSSISIFLILTSVLFIIWLYNAYKIDGVGFLWNGCSRCGPLWNRGHDNCGAVFCSGPVYPEIGKDINNYKGSGYRLVNARPKGDGEGLFRAMDYGPMSN